MESLHVIYAAVFMSLIVGLPAADCFKRSRQKAHGMETVTFGLGCSVRRNRAAA